MIQITNPQCIEIDKIVMKQLVIFEADINRTLWIGREREAISLFVFGYLINACNKNSVLKEPTQIGIEVAVPQLKESGRKETVCKDLVIWSKPRLTCWNSDKNPTMFPLCILEWKFNKQREVETDVDWLCKFSHGRDSFIGYSVHLRYLDSKYTVEIKKIYNGIQESVMPNVIRSTGVEKGAK